MPEELFFPAEMAVQRWAPVLVGELPVGRRRRKRLPVLELEVALERVARLVLLNKIKV
jgi:hypothetical protein